MRSGVKSDRRSSRFLGVAAALTLAPLLSLLVTGSRVEAAAAEDLLPDLSMTKPSGLRLETTASGSRLLRMTTAILNLGKGPFETRASRRSTSVSTMHVSQRIYNTAGGSRVHETTATAKYAGDGHNHWHVQGVASYALYAPTGKGPVLRRDSKVGFCFFDTNPYRLSLPGAPGARQYGAAGCGTRSSLFVKNGISVGWSDVYPAGFAWQWISVTNLAAGEYLLKISADPNGQFEELVETNNCNWSRIRIPRTGSTVTVVETGSGCLMPGEPGSIPTGQVIVPPRPRNDAGVDADAASVRIASPPVALICQIPA